MCFVATNPSATIPSATIPSVNLSAVLNRASATSFSQSKRLLAALYKNHAVTFYCHCTFNGKSPNLKSCGVTHRKQVKRMNRIEWEHVTPAHRIAGHRECWKNGGRKNCSKQKVTGLAFADLHNLVPSLGEVNGDRSNYKFVESIPGEIRKYGACDFEVSNRKAEPPEYAKGFIGRAYLYMNLVYGIGLSQEELRLMNQWNRLNPPSQWEIERNNIIAKKQGNRNPFIQ